MFSQAEENPVGSYVTTFQLAEGLKEKMSRIRFRKVPNKPVCVVERSFRWLMQKIHHTVRIDLTPYLEEENRLAVEVHKRRAQQPFRKTKIFPFLLGFSEMSVLVARGKNHLEDLWLLPHLDDHVSQRKIGCVLIFENLTAESDLQVRVLDFRSNKRSREEKHEIGETVHPVLI